MLRNFRNRLLAAAIVLSAAPFAVTAPAQAQVSFSIGFDSFHDQLSPYGSWVYSDRWGTVWQPDVPADFRPYDTGGRWEYTSEYGWTWISDYDWGDIAFHYGRWVNDPDDGWLWMPGYVWSPAWVVWRGNNDYTGWMAMPPDDNFLSGRGDIGVSVSWGDPDRYYTNWYGSRYSGRGSMWVFVNTGHIADRDYHRYAVRRDQIPGLVQQTRNITNYTVVNNYVVNRSVDVRRVEQASGRQIRPVAARQVFKHPDRIATVSHGDQVRSQMLQVAPRGMGKPNSAPAPSQAMVSKLSDHPARTGGRPSHLFNKTTIDQAGDRFKGRNAMPNATGTPPTATGMKPGLEDRTHGPRGQQNPPTQNGAAVGPTTTTTGPAPQDRSHIQRGFQKPPVDTGATVPPGPRNPGPDAVPLRTPPDKVKPDISGERRHVGEPAVTPPPTPDNTDQRRGLRMQHTPAPVSPPPNATPPVTHSVDSPRVLHSVPNVQTPPGPNPSGPDAAGPTDRARGHRPDEPVNPPPKQSDDKKKKPGSEGPPN